MISKVYLFSFCIPCRVMSILDEQEDSWCRKSSSIMKRGGYAAHIGQLNE